MGGKLVKAYLMPHPPIMVHEVGRGREEDVARTISSALNVAEEIGTIMPDTIIIVVPPHGPAFGDAMSINIDSHISGDLGKFGASSVKFENDTDMELVNLIMRESAGANIPIVALDKDLAKRYKISDELDHGSMVPLYFINKKYRRYNLVHITYGILSNEELYHFGRIIRNAVEKSGKRVVLISSGDLSHRLTTDAPAGYTPMGEKFDNLIVGLLEKHDTDKIMEMDRELLDTAGECGYRSILVMLGSLDGMDVSGQVLSYEGPFGVGYCVAGYELKDIVNESSKVSAYFDKRNVRIKEIRQTEDQYVQLARKSLEHYIKTEEPLKIPAELPEEMIKDRAGVFVSLKKHGQLRGCIGTIQAVQNSIAEEIIENAISSGTRDPRFYPVEENELHELEYSVDILGKAEPIKSKDELDPKRYGVIVRKGRRSGLLLPNIEGIDDIDEQVSIALKKAGIDENEDYSMERFEVIRHK